MTRRNVANIAKLRISLFFRAAMLLITSFIVSIVMGQFGFITDPDLDYFVRIYVTFVYGMGIFFIINAIVIRRVKPRSRIFFSTAIPSILILLYFVWVFPPWGLEIPLFSMLTEVSLNYTTESILNNISNIVTVLSLLYFVYKIIRYIYLYRTDTDNKDESEEITQEMWFADIYHELSKINHKLDILIKRTGDDVASRRMF